MDIENYFNKARWIYFPLFLIFMQGWALPGICQALKTEDKLPNIIIILADDMGYGDISALNILSRIQTPALDQLISKGISFRNAHASASVCTPSRYGLLTGRYAFRSSAAANGIWGFDKPVIEEKRESLASLLKNVGYSTACIGKWHLGLDWQTKDGSRKAVMDADSGYSNVDYTRKVTNGPNDHGFDYSFVHPASLDIPPYVFLRNHSVVDPDIILTTEVYPSRMYHTQYSWDKKHTDDLAVYWEKGVWWRQGEMSRSFRIEDCHQSILAEGISYIDKQVQEKPEEPFFLYLPLTGPHTPWMPADRFKGKSSIGLYGDFVMQIDDAVAQISSALIKNKISENTILIFASDNGAYWPVEEINLHNHDSNQDRRGQKGDIWDGGHRIPLIVSWPAKILQAGEYDQMVSLTDLFATFSDLTGQESTNSQSEDSFSFWHVLNGNLNKPTRSSMVHHSSRGLYGIRTVGWKYIEGLGSGGFTDPFFEDAQDHGPQGQLYRIDSDTGERENLYLKHPDKVAEMQKMLNVIKAQK